MATLIRQLVPMAGDFIESDGVLHLVEDDEAKRLIDAGYAERVVPEHRPHIEKAIKTPPEKR